MDGKGAGATTCSSKGCGAVVKYEEVYLKAYDTVSAARAGLARYFDFYNMHRPHSTLDGKTPMKLTSPRCSATRKAA